MVNERVLQFVLAVMAGAVVRDMRYGRAVATSVVAHAWDDAHHVPVKEAISDAANDYINYQYGDRPKRPEWLPLSTSRY